MKAKGIIFFMMVSLFFILTDLIGQKIIAFGLKETDIRQSHSVTLEMERSSPARVYLRRATGNLEIHGYTQEETYEAYFHIPIPFQEQVPILIEVESPHLIDYRFVHLNPPNVIVAARMRQAEWTEINWTAWVLVKEKTYSDLPDFVSLPDPEGLPESVKKWLMPTDCSQISAPIVMEKAKSLRDNALDLVSLADSICSFCYDIPWEFPHKPVAFDAVYTLKWGNSCTGHAHAGAALFRANGIPARSLLNIPVWASGASDMHWIVDYYVPDYGWVRMETSIGRNPVHPETEVVTFASNPEDEFCLFFPCAIDGCWHSSDPYLGMWNPDWGQAHRAYDINMTSAPSNKIELAHSLTDSVFFFYSHYWGIKLTSTQKARFQDAFSKQETALTDLRNSDLDGYIKNMQGALDHYEQVNPKPITTFFFEDFEGGENGWSHGGNQDEWEWGKPTCGPEKAYSGKNCWGIDLDDTYENNADCWLMSPQINLTKKACSYLSFWVWNSVQDQYGIVHDPLWLDTTTDGTTFHPLCSEMGGVNDDPEIPDVGGWSRVVLDLTKYAGHTVQVRFRFRSNADTVWPGSYIDDIHVYGRDMILKKDIPKAPKELMAKAESWNRIQLGWRDSSKNEDGFKIDRKKWKKGNWNNIAIVTDNTTAYTDRGLKANSIYYYRVQAFNSYGHSAFSNITKARTKKKK